MSKFMRQKLYRVANKVAAPVRDPSQQDEDVGLGDMIHGVTHRLGIPHCAPCARRKARANKVRITKPR